MRCKQCSAIIRTNYAYCANCGNKIDLSQLDQAEKPNRNLTTKFFKTVIWITAIVVVLLGVPEIITEYQKHVTRSNTKNTDIQTEYQFDSSELNPENKPIFVGLSVLISEFETTTYFFGRMVTPQNTTDWVLMKEVYNKDRGTTRYAEYVQLPNKDSYFEMVAIVKYKNHSFETETKRFDHTYEGNLFVVHGAP